jgi:hypothetical protein
MPQPSRYVTARLSIRRGTRDQWEAENTILLEGEPAWEIDTKRLKIGDGETAWNDLSYFNSGDSETAGSVIHDASVLPEYVNSVTGAVEYFGAKIKVYDEQGANEFIAGLTGGAPKYVVTLAAGTGGTASFVNENDNVFDQGYVVNIKATAFPGYEFDYWGGDVSQLYEPDTTFVVTEDSYIRANFKLIT